MNYKMNIIDLFWRRVDNLEKQIERLPMYYGKRCGKKS